MSRMNDRMNRMNNDDVNGCVNIFDVLQKIEMFKSLY